ncbi:7009_t:CDS:1, partial [Scutellospora calospora]
FTSISSDFGEFVSAEDTQTVLFESDKELGKSKDSWIYNTDIKFLDNLKSTHQNIPQQNLESSSSFLFEFGEMVSSVNDYDSLNQNLKQDKYKNSLESNSKQDSWMSLSDLSFLESITNSNTTSSKISFRKQNQDLLLDFNNICSVESAAK